MAPKMLVKVNVPSNHTFILVKMPWTTKNPTRPMMGNIPTLRVKNNLQLELAELSIRTFLIHHNESETIMSLNKSVWLTS